MKEFRKNQEDQFICEECGRFFKFKKSLSQHVNWYHNLKNYFDKWIKEESEGTCPICGEESIFLNFKKGYNNGCCSSHIHKYAYQKRAIFLKRKYGVENNFEREECKEKIKETNIEKYGFENAGQNEEIKKKIRESMMKNHGVNSYLEKRDEIKKAMNKKYGVDSPLQNETIFKKVLKTRRLLKKFKYTEITYQGSYELDFLEKFYDKIDIKNSPSIPYVFEGKNKVYHPDFFIPSLNLVVEIKSDYILSLDIEINEKKQACLNKGYDYILILNKGYIEFNKLTSQSISNSSSN